MLKKLLKKNQGFTLVEIIIVLAIVALIFVIVFLAVAAAQRGQRDTARKDNVNRMIAAIAQAQANSDGIPPDFQSNNCGGGTCNYAAGTPTGEAAWSVTLASPVMKIARDTTPTTTVIDWSPAPPDSSCPQVAGATGYVSIKLDDGTTEYCKNY